MREGYTQAARPLGYVVNAVTPITLALTVWLAPKSGLEWFSYLRGRRRVKRGNCWACGYEMDSTICPECGTQIPVLQSEPRA